MPVLYMFLTCRPYIDRCYNRIQTMMKGLGCNEYVFVVGGDSESYNADTQILRVDCDDYYEGLSEKVFKAYRFIHNSPLFSHCDYVCKADEDLVLKQLLEPTILSDYCGVVYTWNPGNPTWHFGKCHNNAFNSIRYVSPWVPWCSGGNGYILSRTSLAAIAADTLLLDAIEKDRVEQSVVHRMQYIYEDLYVATILRKHNIVPAAVVKLSDYLYSRDHTVS